VVRHEIDDRSLEGKGSGQFILSGSAAPTDNETRHSGSMRITKVSVDTMSLMESGDSSNLVNFADLFKKNVKVNGISKHDVDNYIDFIIRGGWPQLTSLSPENATKKIADYVNNISSVDLRTLNSEPDPIRTAALIRSLSRNIATNATLETISTETKISRQTIRKYLDQLTQIFILNELHP
jgi:predicted AAA+ superfamily ATPase